MKYRIIFYCPDRHTHYDGETPYSRGIGGGITARVRMAKALANLGCRVISVANCAQRRMIDGVEYCPIDSINSWEGDVLILSTSGGEMDLTPFLDLDLTAIIRILWVHGIAKPGSLDRVSFNYIYTVSDFIRNIVSEDWGLPAPNIITSKNSFDEKLFAYAEEANPERDPYKLVYFSHPSKGLEFALCILAKLREYDSRYHLEVLGGTELWGGPKSEMESSPGVRFRGLLGQQAVVHTLLQSTFSLQLQTREEPGPLAAIEAMRAGCVVMASDVGAYKEYVEDGRAGLIFTGDPGSEETQSEVVSKILELGSDSERLSSIQHHAVRSPQSSEEQASAWLKHWDTYLEL